MTITITAICIDLGMWYAVKHYFDYATSTIDRTELWCADATCERWATADNRWKPVAFESREAALAHVARRGRIEGLQTLSRRGTR